MKSKLVYLLCLCIFLISEGCKKSDNGNGGDNAVAPSLQQIELNNLPFTQEMYGVNNRPVIKIRFSQPIKESTLNAVSITDAARNSIPLTVGLSDNNVLLTVTPGTNLKYLEKFDLRVSIALQSTSGGNLAAAVERSFVTGIDSSRKFPVITNDALLTKVQQQTFKYFWDFAHPVSGLTRERNTSGETVTSGGSGFGIMAIPVGIERGFITRAEGLARLQKIVGFLTNNVVKVKGAFSHWINGTTGAIVPFSANDNGADIVETSFLMMGLLTARQYFDGTGAEATLRNDINTLYHNVEWDWFRRDGQNVLYWHYSPDKLWAMNLPISGWNEALITYVLAAASPTHSIPKIVYDNGWARNGNIRNGATYYGYNLPVGPNMGGPLFLSQYSFLGIKPIGLSDAYADYEVYARNHTLINYEYSKANPKNYYGYSDSVWGLTASDIPNSYAASSPTNDVGMIAPTAALSAFPYAPEKSMAALHFFYYVLGDKLWKEYGFTDAFSLHQQWFATSHLAIDQGPIIIMIENYRTGLLWNLFTSSPEIKTAMRMLGFTAPYL
ncbi:glucoamylase family protein [Terrimonas rubra]|uniref:Glucoamylase family protein n=1 Tax=Terrimonas rubra TaxID=1035890 RepID=A0ABW6A1E0_9BACT